MRTKHIHIMTVSLTSYIVNCYFERILRVLVEMLKCSTYTPLYLISITRQVLSRYIKTVKSSQINGSRNFTKQMMHGKMWNYYCKNSRWFFCFGWTISHFCTTKYIVSQILRRKNRILWLHYIQTASGGVT